MWEISSPTTWWSWKRTPAGSSFRCALIMQGGNRVLPDLVGRTIWEQESGSQEVAQEQAAAVRRGRNLHERRSNLLLRRYNWQHDSGTPVDFGNLRPRVLIPFVRYIPTVGWQIDTFGHSSAHISILSQLGFDSQFFGRIDYRDKQRRTLTHDLEYISHSF